MNGPPPAADGSEDVTDKTIEALAEIMARVLDDGETPDYLQPCINGCPYFSVRASGLCEFCVVRAPNPDEPPRRWFAALPVYPHTIGPPHPGTPEGLNAYRRGLCGRCLTNRYSPGRTMCDDCWRDRLIPRQPVGLNRRPPTTERSSVMTESPIDRIDR